jgi:hypothetical protein
VAFEGVQAMPRPVQTPVPVVVGGRTAPAFRRAVTQGHGWYGFGLDVATTETFVAALGEAAKRYPRPAELGRLEISITPPAPGVPDQATIDAYTVAGVDRLILRPTPEMDAPALERFATDAGRTLRLPS